MRCPRCRREIADPVPAFCTQCGAPLRLADDPAPRPLEASFSIDRRIAERLEADETFTGFTPAGIVAGAAATAAPGPSPGQRIRDVAARDRSHWDLGGAVPREGGGPAAAAPAPPQEVAEPDADIDVDALEIHLRRPPAWRRAAAGVADVAPFAAGGIALSRALVRAAGAGLPAPATGLDGFLDLVVRERVIVASVAVAVALALGVYATLAHALAGATLGKRLLGLRVVGPDGARPSLARSAARSALVVLSVGLFGLGVVLALFTRSGRALHDLLARTWVVEAP
ncbi:MAG TPA: RDD family protein [Anaeromyxobacter sp.]